METILSLLVLTATAAVDHVVVFPDRAQVTRSAVVRCAPGAMAQFTELPPAAELSSFRARTDSGAIEGLRVEERTREARFAPQLAEVEKKLRELEREQATLADARSRTETAARLGARYADVAVQLVSREMSEPKPDLKAWQAAFDVALTTRLQAAAQVSDTAGRERELAYQLEGLRRQQSRLAAASQRKEYVADVQVRCQPGGNARVELTYLVGGASWEPAYEARADEGAATVELTTFATVRQATGEDWAKSRLVLSTAIPAQNATPPEISPLKVFSQKREDTKKVLVRRDERVERAEAQQGQGPVGGEGGLAARAQGLSVQLEVPELADVPGDGTPARLMVNRTRMRASFAYRAAPKAMPFVFRVADLTNAAPFPLLPGPLDAFRKHGLIGRYSLSRVPQGGVFHLSFGIEESLRVERTVVEELKRDAGLFGGMRRFRYGYRFVLANHGKTSAEVQLEEHVPISELDDIKVEIASKTSSGFKVDPADGVGKWQLKLSPGDRKTLELAFHVDVPSTYESGGL